MFNYYRLVCWWKNYNRIILTTTIGKLNNVKAISLNMWHVKQYTHVLVTAFLLPLLTFAVKSVRAAAYWRTPLALECNRQWCLNTLHARSPCHTGCKQHDSIVNTTVSDNRWVTDDQPGRWHVSWDIRIIRHSFIGTDTDDQTNIDSQRTIHRATQLNWKANGFTFSWQIIHTNEI